MNIPVLLAEKPNQAQAYAQALKGAKKHEGYFEIPPSPLFPKGLLITYAIGHLITLFEPHEYQDSWKHWSLQTLPIIPDPIFKFKVSPDKVKQYNIVARLLKEAEYIIVGTDCDREGESIARLIIDQAGANEKPTKRLWINSLEDEEIIKGLKNLRNGADYIPMAEEAQARQISDWLVGINGSRLYTILLAKKGVRNKQGKPISFSVGRVQSPLLYLIYERQREIEDFKPKPFFELESTFKTSEGNYVGKYKGRYDSKNEILTLLKENGIDSTKQQGIVQDVKKEEKHTKPPQLLSLSSLQILANKKYKYSPQQVLKIVQELYDNPLKLVTYPRTDTPYITENEYSYLKDNLNNYQQITKDIFEPHTLEASKRYVNNEKVQEHYAIVPTKKIPTETAINKLTNEQKNIYFEIIKSALGMFHAPYVYEETTIKTNVKEVTFETKGKTEKLKGWKSLYLNDHLNEEDIEENKEVLLPSVRTGMTCEAICSIKEGKTTKPKQYTEGDLIPLMRDCGKKVKGLDDETKAVLNEVEGLGTEATRSNIIESLKTSQYIEIKKNKVYVTLKGEILCKSIEGTLLAKPELTAKWESYLKRIGKNEGNKKTFVLNTINFTKSLVESTKGNIESLNINSSIESMQQIDVIAVCPTCKKGHIVDKNTFYGCTEYKSGCKQSFPKKKNEKSLTKTQIKQLCEKGKTTSKIKGFKKKDSTEKFEAFLELKDGRLMFAFK